MCRHNANTHFFMWLDYIILYYTKSTMKSNWAQTCQAVTIASTDCVSWKILKLNFLSLFNSITLPNMYLLKLMNEMYMKWNSWTNILYDGCGRNVWVLIYMIQVNQLLVLVRVRSTGGVKHLDQYMIWTRTDGRECLGKPVDSLFTCF